MQKISNPVPIFIDARGTLIDNGNVYIGQANADPQTNPVQAYWDSALTIPATQPIKTLGGVLVNGTNPAQVFIAQSDYSMRLTDAFDTLVFYSPSVFVSGVSYQPLDSDLTTISGQTNTAYGLALLTLANQAALVTATGLTPFTGGTVTTAITRQGSGVYAYGSDPAMTGMRIFKPLPVGSTNPASQPGDIQGFY